MSSTIVRPAITNEGLRSRIRYSGVVYDGGLIRQPFGLIVVDIEGVTIVPEGRQPSLYNHKPESPVGHHEAIVDRKAMVLRVANGVISLDNQASREVVSGVGNDHPWQASIRGRFSGVKAYKAGQKVWVNGRRHEGPILVARKLAWHETSWTGLGAAAGQPLFNIEFTDE